MDTGKMNTLRCVMSYVPVLAYREKGFKFQRPVRLSRATICRQLFICLLINHKGPINKHDTGTTNTSY